MKNFEFALYAEGLDHTADDFEDRIYEAGCDDASISYQQGRIILDFYREAADLDEALGSAIKNAKSAGLDITGFESDDLIPNNVVQKYFPNGTDN